MCQSLQFRFYLFYSLSRDSEIAPTKKEIGITNPSNNKKCMEIGVENPSNNGESLSRELELAPTKKSKSTPNALFGIRRG